VTTYELATLFAIFAGPVVAVAITLWIDARRKDREQKLLILRMLLATRHLVGDPLYSQAINLIPISFAGRPKITGAYKDYMDAVRVVATPENSQSVATRSAAKQSRLIFEIARDLGYDIAESDIQIDGYAADAWIKRDLLSLDSQKAMRDIAQILALQTKILMSQPLSEIEQATVENQLPKP
jgi:hypothetical protein